MAILGDNTAMLSVFNGPFNSTAITVVRVSGIVAGRLMVTSFSFTRVAVNGFLSASRYTLPILLCKPPTYNLLSEGQLNTCRYNVFSFTVDTPQLCKGNGLALEP